MSSNESVVGLTSRPAKIADYIAIMRLDHATKHIFVVPQELFSRAAPARPSSPYHGLVIRRRRSGCGAADRVGKLRDQRGGSDRDSDALHPTKSSRTAVADTLGRIGRLGAVVRAGRARPRDRRTSSSRTMLFVAIAFAAQGIIYNVKPLRSKDYPYVDVLTESVNNPLRLMIGWAMVDPSTLPPASIIVGYWLGGAFLMGAKRLSEYREIVSSHGRDLLVRYRASFAGYDETNLASSCLIYALLSAMALAIFFVKYRIEYVFVLPPIAILFGKYLALSMQPASTAQKPERLFRESGLMTIVAIIVAIFALFSVVNIPMLEPLMSQQFIELK